VYDYVIVGAGSAGCVLAARLSEDSDVKVAVLEAGGRDDRPEIAMPIAFPMLLKSSVDWDLFGEPEPGLGGRRLYLPRGKVLGGSGSINAMIYVRGHRADYDGWAAAGAGGWSYEEVLPYFRRSEDNERGEDVFHGVGGPMAVSDSRAMSPLIETMIEASVLAGIPRNPDFNGAEQEGVGRFQLTQRDGRRCSTAAAFLHPAEGRPNLDVITDAMALQILIDGRRAVGVEVARGGKVEEIRAQREVILSAGTYQSPVLLMVSGIGPAEDLEPFGIEVRESLPVGHNLQDHLMAQLNYETDEPSLHGVFVQENF
jgi:choline dehydrogenase-like flavoprotein